MANFTTSQANACTITMMKKIVQGSNISWFIQFNDADGNGYDTTLNGLGDDPSASDIKTAVINEVVDNMLKIGAQPTEATIVTTKVTDKGLGETLG